MRAITLVALALSGCATESPVSETATQEPDLITLPAAPEPIPQYGPCSMTYYVDEDGKLVPDGEACAE